MSKREAYLEMYAHKIATFMFVEAAKETSSSSWCMYFDEIEEQYKVDLNKDKELVEAILEVLYTDFNNIITEAWVEVDCFCYGLYYNYCLGFVDDELEERGLEYEDL